MSDRYVLRVPAQLTFKSGSRLVEEIDGLPATGEFLLDVGKMTWIEPFAMLHLASAVGRKIADNPGVTFRARGERANGYARHMGFYRELGLSEPAALVATENHDNYLPIQALNLREVRASAARFARAPGALIDRHSQGIARALAREGHGPLWGTLQYALREIIRNAAEHSESDHVLYCGQYWPSRNRVEVAILDEGIGIAHALRRNPHVAAASEAQLLRLSLEPGISGVAHGEQPADDRDEWANSGFGLFVVSELCRRGGGMTLVSGRSGLRVSEAGVEDVRSSHRGTALRLEIDTGKLRSIAASLALIVAEGEKRARARRLGPTSASSASKRTFV